MDDRRLTKYIEGNASQPEKEAVAAWIESSEANRRRFLALRRTYDYALMHETEYQQTQRPAASKRLFTEIAKIAAIIALTFVITTNLFRKPEPEKAAEAFNTFFVPAGQRANLTLPDGTNVWLNSKTTLTYPTDFNKDNREVILDGEAYFKVKHTDGSTFTVKTLKYDINATGTEFNVAAYSCYKCFEAALIEGSVSIASHKNKLNVTLEPGQRIYSTDTALIRGNIRDLDHYLWKEGILKFQNETMGVIIQKLELYFDTKITVNNRKILDIPYTGKFWTNDGVEQVLRVLKIHAHFNYEKDNETNRITIY